ncbi:MAG TPA: septal ring lytic transglycosylase RlpA family protein [Thermoanaerobaculia bacterium]
MVALIVLAYGCTTTQPAQPAATGPQLIRGVASWYGEEFAGRTTANGEIFDPLLLTAAHRTLPFGTIADITNPKTGQKVRVRVNDRGPYIGNRIIDLSYAAAQQIGLIEPGIGEVEIAVVQLGRGDREPPAPFVATIAPARPADSAPPVPVVVAPPPPKPAPVATPPAQIDAVPADVVVDRVEVQEERGGVSTRRQVSSDGRTLESVPVDESEEVASVREVPTTTVDRRPPSAGSIRSMPVRKAAQRFVVQVGAFSIEANANALRERLVSIGQPRAYIDREALYRVRIGPFPTRDEALAVRSALEASGISAIIVAE